MIKQTLSRLLPFRLRTPLRSLYYSLKYSVGVRVCGRDPLIPPGSLHFAGSPEFKEIGEEFFRYFRDLGGLQPDDHVLDVGSGTGRMARPLTAFLEAGSYDGIDIVAESIRWCQLRERVSQLD